MKQDFDYNEYIERYLHEEMSPEEKVWFEKELEGNLSLKSEVNIRKQVDLVLADKDLIDLKIQLNQIHKEIYEATEQSRTIVRRIYKKVLVGTVAIAVLSISFVYYLSNRNYSNEKLVEVYYQPAQTSINFRSADPEKGILTEAMSLYNNKEYKKAIRLFEEILEKDNSKLGINLYSGISHMEVKEYSKANERFQNILDEKPNPFVESANWYLGLCYIMTNDRDKAYKVFDKLADQKGFYQKDAKRILKRIK